MDNMKKGGIALIGLIAIVLSAATAMLFGGILFALVRGTPWLDIVALIIVMIITAALLFLIYLRDSPGDSELLLTGIGATVGFLGYDIWYVVVKGFGELGTGEMIVAIVLAILAVLSIIFTYKILRGKPY